MGVLIVYYSKTGNTKAVAQFIATATGGALEEIVETGAKRDGVFGWLRSGRDGMRGRTSVIAPPQADVKEYDTVFVGSPVWGWNLVPAVRTYLSSADLSGKRVALFCTMGSSGERKTFDSMRGLAAGSRILGELAVRQAELSDAVTLQERVGKWVEEIRSPA
jgi:flavodoxin